MEGREEGRNRECNHLIITVPITNKLSMSTLVTTKLLCIHQLLSSILASYHQEPILLPKNWYIIRCPFLLSSHYNNNYYNSIITIHDNNTSPNNNEN